MAGKGERFGSSLPKQYHKLSGKPVFIHTLNTFLQSGLFQEIILVCAQEMISKTRNMIAELSSSTPIILVPGAEDRRSSSYAGICAASNTSTHVLIHDAVRPFVSFRILKENIEYAMRYGAVDTCIPSADTIVHSLDGNTICDIPKRSDFLRGQTPQSFSIDIIKRAHKKAIEEKFHTVTDDCMLVQRMGIPIHLVRGEETNIKITTELDLYLAEQIFRLPRQKPRSVPQSLNGKTYIVTGGTGGIGSTIVSELKERGVNVIPLSLSSHPFKADLSNQKQAQDVFEEIFKQYGPVDGLINSIGVLIHAPFHALDTRQIDHLISSNLMSLIYSCRFAKIKPKGHILNIASSSFFKGRKNLATYSATKAAAVNFTQALAEELPNLFINALAPQRTSTSMRKNNFTDDCEGSLLSTSEVSKAAIDIISQNESTGMIFEVKKNAPIF
jgi:2-C-methyl-D-erythritol 4-phosphate cytidylyltransferase